MSTRENPAAPAATEKSESKKHNHVIHELWKHVVTFLLAFSGLFVTVSVSSFCTI